MVRLVTSATEVTEDGVSMVEIDFSKGEDSSSFKGTEIEPSLASESVLFEIITQDGESRGFLMKVSDFENITKFIKS